MCSSTPSEVTLAKRLGSAASRSSSGLTARHSVHQLTPSWRARPAIVACWVRREVIAQLTARVVIEPRGWTKASACSMNVPREHPGSGQRHTRWRQTSWTAVVPWGTSCSTRCRRPRLGATTPHEGQPINCHGVETVTTSRSTPRSTPSTWTVSCSPSRTSQCGQGTELASAPAHAVASDMSRSSKVDQWLALLILGDLDPYTPPITPRVSLPTRSTKSQIGWPPRRPRSAQVLGLHWACLYRTRAGWTCEPSSGPRRRRCP